MFYVICKVKKEHLFNLPVDQEMSVLQVQFPALDRISPHYGMDCLLALLTLETQIHFPLGAAV